MQGRDPVRKNRGIQKKAGNDSARGRRLEVGLAVARAFDPAVAEFVNSGTPARMPVLVVGTIGAAQAGGAAVCPPWNPVAKKLLAAIMREVINANAAEIVVIAHADVLTNGDLVGKVLALFRAAATGKLFSLEWSATTRRRLRQRAEQLMRSVAGFRVNEVLRATAPVQGGR